MADDFYWAPGTLSKAQLLADDSYRVKNFPLQADVNPAWSWMMVSDGVIVPYVERQQALTTRYGAQGKPNGKVRLINVTPLMWDYLDDTFWQGAQTAICTMQLPTRFSSSFKWQVWNLLIHKPPLNPPQFGLHGNLGYNTDVAFDVTNLVLAAGQGEYSDDYSEDYAI